MPDPIQFSRLDNAVRVVSCHLPHNHSVMFSLWLQSGARHDPPNQLGLAHLYEHLLYAWLEEQPSIRRYLQNGAKLNAQCGRELTAVFGQCLSEQAPHLIGTLLRAFLNTDLRAWPIEAETKVIANENAWNRMREDDLEQIIAAHVWQGQALANPILGDENHLATIQPGDVTTYHNTLLRGPNITVAATGAIEQEQLLEATAALSELPGPDSPLWVKPEPLTMYHPPKLSWRSESELARMLWVYPAPPFAQDDRLRAHLLNAAYTEAMQCGLGYRMSRAGLNYALRGEVHSYSDGGFWFIASECQRRDMQACLAAFDQFGDDLLAEKIPDSLAMGRRNLVTHWAMEHDDMYRLLEQISLQAIYKDNAYSLADIEQALSAQHDAQLFGLLKRLFSQAGYMRWS